MAHQYSVEIHKFIGDKISETTAELEKAKSQNDGDKIRFLEGRLEEMQFFRSHLSSKYDLMNRKYY